ncbi:CHAD domain protein [Marinomonas aquimarina]|uniref:CHAD domain protein n=1 Tax=Marinomonas aquimarina TaxID=295068 RepID=A0A1A8T7A1_9GAMM|nr:CHAD domain-containing protein [Marinomonas aquimarina]SBS27255.1 CHAD domain protein [Marinomonas aquimarina]
MGKKQLKQHCAQLLSTIEEKLTDLLKQQSDDETIHELRVSVRRITPVLELLIALEQDSQHKKRWRKHKRVFRTLFKTLSAPRDLEVQVKLAQSLADQTIQDSSSLALYIERLQQEKQRLDGQLLASVAGLFVSESIAFARQNAHFDEVKKKTLQAQLQADEKAYKQALKASVKQLKKEAEHFHSTRIQLKKFRYFLELNQVATQVDDERLKTLKTIQDHLGDTNDLHIALKLMAQNHTDAAVIEQVEGLYQDHLQKSVAAIFNNLKPLRLK